MAASVAPPRANESMRVKVGARPKSKISARVNTLLKSCHTATSAAL